MLSLFRGVLIVLMLVDASITAGNAHAEKPSPTPPTNPTAWPGQTSVWHGYDRFDFEVDGRKAYVVTPNFTAPGRPWVWRARFPNFHSEADQILLARGFHVAHIDTNGMLGSERAMKHWDAFYAFMIDKGLNRRVALEGVSRGGLFIYGFASRWPQRVTCIYGDTPVADIKSWPGGKGTGRGDAGTWQVFLKEYGFTETQAMAFAGNPIDCLQPIAAANIPILHLVSLNDVIVPPAENTFVIVDRYRALGGSIDVIEVPEGTQQSGGHHFPHPDPTRVADFIERHSACLPSDHDYFVLRGNLDHCRHQFEVQKRGRVAFMGGSITAMDGWRELTCQYLQLRFPTTKFDFIDAGISSTGSVPGAFRFAHDVLAAGQVDLLFEEAAVNDLHNMRQPIEMIRGMEGIVRQARRANPKMDVVMMHFVDPKHMTDYRHGNTPEVITQHETVAEHYGVSTIQLAQEITERIDASQFQWDRDFVNLHPSPYGHQIYAATIRRTLSTAWAMPPSSEQVAEKHPLPQPLDRFSFDGGKFVAFSDSHHVSNFEVIADCDPAAEGVGGSVRAGFANVPMWVGTRPGASFSLTFTGRAVGLLVAAGPDAGVLSYRIDGGSAKTLDLFTKWSRSLHIPWAYVLESELEPGEHTIEIEITEQRNEQSTGHACRIVRLLVND